MGEQHDQKDMIDDLPHRAKYGKIYCPHCKKESPDYYDNCIHCGKDVGYQLGSDKTDPPPKGWISRDSGNLKSSDRAFRTGWSVVKQAKVPLPTAAQPAAAAPAQPQTKRRFTCTRCNGTGMVGP